MRIPWVSVGIGNEYSLTSLNRNIPKPGKLDVSSRNRADKRFELDNYNPDNLIDQP